MAGRKIGKGNSGKELITNHPQIGWFDEALEGGLKPD
jgi:hypothetical protein